MSLISRSSDVDSPADAPSSAQPEPRLNQPWRAVVALVELVLAGLAVWLAVYLWSSGVVTIRQSEPLVREGVVEVTRYLGDRIAFAVLAGLAAALFVLDAVRQLMLALRVRPRRGRGADDAEPWPSFDEDS